MQKIVGKVVEHKFFGKGIVIGQNDNYVEIEFENNMVKKIGFEVFETYISLSDNELQTEAKNYAKELKSQKDEHDKKEIVDKIKICSMKTTTVSPKTHVTTMSWGKSIVDKLTTAQQINDAAHKVYDECCKVFGWDKTKKGFFGKQQSLYAANVTPEHYSVWCLGNSNWTGTKNGIWKNEISIDYKTIIEKWDDISKNTFFDDRSDRVVFAKKSNGIYIFLGVYKCSFIDEKAKTKTFEQISNVYPIKN